MALLLLISVPFLSGNAAAEGESEHDYHNSPWTFFIFPFIMTFGTVSLLAGLFAIRYGQKNTKRTAVPMIAVGLVTWGVWIYFNFIAHAEYPNDTIFDIIHWVASPILLPFMALLGVAMGAGLSIIIFLTAVVRS